MQPCFVSSLLCELYQNYHLNIYSNNHKYYITLDAKANTLHYFLYVLVLTERLNGIINEKSGEKGKVSQRRKLRC